MRLLVVASALLAQVAQGFFFYPMTSPPVLSRRSSDAIAPPTYGRRAAMAPLASTRKQKTLAEELDDLRLDESTLSEAERKKLQGVRASYKLDGVLDFEGAGSNEPIAGGSRRQDDPDYDPLDDAEDLAIAETAWSGQAGLDVEKAGNNNWSDLTSRPLLALGDVGFLLLFATIGRSIHSGGFHFDLQALGTAAPFLGAWLLVAPLLGAYTPGATRSTGDALGALVKAWAVAVPLGLAGRGLIKGEVPPTPFIGVAMLMTLVFLATWRSVYVQLTGAEIKGGQGNKKSGVFDVFRMVTTLINRW